MTFATRERLGPVPQLDMRVQGAYWTPAEKMRLNAVQRVLGRRRFYRLLDVGCGFGEFTMGVATNFGVPDVCGVDFSQAAVDAAGKRGVTSTRANLNSDSLPFPDGAFDLAIMVESIEHLEDVEHCLQEVARVVRPGGSLVVTTPNLASWHGRLSLLVGYQPFSLDVGFRRHYGSIMSFSGLSSGHIRGFTLPALKEILEEFNFRVEAVASSPSPIPGDFRGKSVLSVADRLLSRFPSIASDVVVGCSRESATRNA